VSRGSVRSVLKKGLRLPHEPTLKDGFAQSRKDPQSTQRNANLKWKISVCSRVKGETTRIKEEEI
jgi:hypothetical protein